MPNTREKPTGRLTLPHYGGKGHYMKCSEQFGCSGECADCEELDKIVERLAYYEDMIANGVTVQKWISVTERLPEHFGTFIVAVFENDPDNTMYADSADFNPFEKSWRTHGYFAKGCEITHWMPLPEPPKGE